MKNKRMKIGIIAMLSAALLPLSSPASIPAQEVTGTLGSPAIA